MKIALGLLALPAVFGLKKTHKTRAIRKLNDQQQYDVDEYEFLQNYEQIYVTCDAEMSVMNQEGEYEYGAVVTRFCPTGATCDTDGTKKCEGGYGDYVVGIETYMQQFLEQFERGQEDNQNNNQNNGDDGFEFNFGEFGECRQFEVEQNENDGNQDGYDQAQAQYYIGPKCDGGNIRIALFTDEDCTAESYDVSFEDLTGVALPWSTSIIEDDDCKPYYCYGANENGEYEYNEFCTTMYEQANLKCETDMETFSPYGKSEGGCETIAAMLPVSSSGGNAGVFIIILIVAAVVGFGIWYFLQQKKKTAASQEGLMM